MGVESYIRFPFSQQYLIEGGHKKGSTVDGLCFGICLEYARLCFSKRVWNLDNSFVMKTLLEKQISFAFPDLEANTKPKTRIGERVLLYQNKYQVFLNKNSITLDKIFSIDPVKGMIFREKISDLFQDNRDVLGITFDAKVGHVIAIRKFQSSIDALMIEKNAITYHISRISSNSRMSEVEKMVDNEMARFRDSSEEFYYVFDPNFGETKPLTENEVIQFLNELLLSKYENKYTNGYFTNLSEILAQQLIFRGGEHKYNDPSKLQYQAFLRTSAHFFASFAAEEAMRICGKKPADFIDDEKAKILLSEQALRVYETGAATIDDLNLFKDFEIRQLICGWYNRLFKFGNIKIKYLLDIDCVKFMSEDLKRYPATERFSYIERMRISVWNKFLNPDFEVFYKNKCFTILQLAELEPKMFESVKKHYLKKFVFDGISISYLVQIDPDSLSNRDDLREPLSEAIDKIKRKERSFELKSI